MNSFVLLGFQSDALALKLLADVERFGMLFHGDVDADNEEVLVWLPIPFPFVEILVFPHTEDES